MDRVGSEREEQHAPIAVRLRALHEISMELSRAADVGSLCKRAVERCIERLEFDRVGIWFIDPEDPRWTVGTWGTDEAGQPRDESGRRVPRSAEDQRNGLYDGSIPYVLVKADVVFDDRKNPVGRADKAIAPLWDGTRVVGEIVADNLLSQRSMIEDDGEILAILARTVAHLSALKRSDAALKAAVESKAVLLGEIQHRTKNSFAMMRSLISLEANRAGDSPQAATLKKLRDRVSVLTSLYRQLDLSSGLDSVSLDGYLRKIAADLMDGYGAETMDVSLRINLEPIKIDMKHAVPLGLIVNELITDALKHAFPAGRHGTIAMSLCKAEGEPRLPGEEEQILLSVSDDGVGLPADFDTRSTKSLGLTLVTMLCSQIGAKLDIGPGQGGQGASFALRFRR